LAARKARAYVVDVAESWKELLASFFARSERNELPIDLVWDEFRRQAAFSTLPALDQILMAGESMTQPRERALLAVAVSPLLAELDWPRAWDKARQDLVLTLEPLVRAMEPETTLKVLDFAGTLGGGPRAVLLLMGITKMSASALGAALIALRKPCVPGELNTVAHLCNMGTALINSLPRGPSAQLLSKATDNDKPDVSRLLDAFERYTHAARAMNKAVGTVLFTNLDLGAGEASDASP